MSDSGSMRHDAQQGRYEWLVEGKVAGFVAYQEQGNAVRMTHTEMEPAYQGGGHASQLAQQALDDVRQRGCSVIPTCAFIARYIERHPQYRDLVDRTSAG